MGVSIRPAGTSPLSDGGHFSGFSLQTPKPDVSIKHLVINGAINPGNSGGPVVAPDGTVVGVVVTKWTLSLPAGLASALKALNENKSGVQFTSVGQDGKSTNFVESQLVAALLDYYAQCSQVFIGEAIAASELTGFLDERKIPWNSPSGAPLPKSTKP